MSSSSSSLPLRIFRAPGRSLDFDTLLCRLDPAASAAEREAIVAGGHARADGVRVRKLRTRVRPGARVELFTAFGPAVDAVEAEGAGRLEALVPALPWSAGTLTRRKGMTAAVSFERIERRGALDRIVVKRPAGDEHSASLATDALHALAQSGYPVVADARRGGVLVEGGLRAGASKPTWPEEPVFPGEDGRVPDLAVSDATRRVLARGHPWVLRDEETGETGGMPAGTRVRVRGLANQDLGQAIIEGPDRLVARLWEEPSDRARSALRGSVEERVERAWRRRSQLLARGDETDVFRLVHGEADGLPGLVVDRLGAVLRVLVTSPGDAGIREAAVDLLRLRLEALTGEAASVVEVVHLRDVPPGEWLRTRLVAGPIPAGSEAASTRLAVRERGVRFLVDPGLTRPTRSSPGFGLYPDQRENRDRLVADAPRRGRLLNLFCHTGAFSVAWLAAGQGEAVSVDLSHPYLRWLEENLAANGIDLARHRAVRQDGRRFLETLDRSERFDAIVVDPPTAAAAGRRFWSVGKDLAPLVERALRHLTPGGRLLVCRNDRQRSELADLLEKSAARAGVQIASQAAAGPGADFPSRPGFPEGDPFSGVLATRA